MDVNIFMDTNLNTNMNENQNKHMNVTIHNLQFEKHGVHKQHAHVCVCVCVCVCVHTHTHTHTHMYVQINVHTCIYIDLTGSGWFVSYNGLFGALVSLICSNIFCFSKSFL